MISRGLNDTDKQPVTFMFEKSIFCIGVLGVGILALGLSLEIGNRVIDLMKYGSALNTCLLIDLERHHFHF